MNRLLILLCMAGWALYIVHTNDRGDNLASQNPKFSEEPSPAAQAPVDSIPSELQPIPATAVQSPHAITPDGMPRRNRECTSSCSADAAKRECQLAARGQSRFGTPTGVQSGVRRTTQGHLGNEHTK